MKRHFRIAEQGGRVDQRIEHRLQVEGRAADGLRHVADRRLLLQRFAQLLGACLDFVEEPCVLDRNDGLVGEGLQQSMVWSRSLRFRPRELMRPIGTPLSNNGTDTCCGSRERASNCLDGGVRNVLDSRRISERPRPRDCEDRVVEPAGGRSLRKTSSAAGAVGREGRKMRSDRPRRSEDGGPVGRRAAEWRWPTIDVEHRLHVRR